MAVGSAGWLRPSSDEERWEQALRLARELPSPPPINVERERRRSSLQAGIVLLVLLAQLVLLVERLASGPDDGGLLTRPEHAVIALVGLVVMAVGGSSFWVSAWRHRGTAVFGLRPSVPLTWRQRRELGRQVRGIDQVQRAHLPVAIAVARCDVVTGSQPVMGAGMLVFFSGDLARSVAWASVLVAAIAAAALLVVVRFVRVDRPALRFLEAHQAHPS